ncbi:pseudaminic acid synthase [Gracilibacillus lacisalsi]|uniref:pseudaminic acid synthase n=1 Tax=Gracilibacillus lacisalsi TaxID=393087 RepID=UPI000368685E|nr:pseudaminic acid synthase [Gracilibacillus lacisalsi]
MKEITIANRRIGLKSRPFIIAEMSGNHNQSLEKALEIVESAAATGVDALKLQTYTPDTMTLNIGKREFYIDDDTNLWKGNSLYNLYEKAYTPWEWHQKIFERCQELGLIAFSSPFDESAVDFLEELNVPCYKIASFENVDIPLIRKVAKTGKPIIMSTGMATASELDEAVRAAKSEGCTELILLKCTSTYPASASNSNLKTIPHMRELFECQVGLSDHTLGIGTAVTSIALGATVIEKHFTLSRKQGGIDADFSMEPNEMRALVLECTRAWESIGQVHYGPTDAEKSSLIHRRSLYITQSLRPGDVLTKENIRAIRPGLGLSPKYLNDVLGKPVAKSVKKGTPLSFDIFFKS